MKRHELSWGQFLTDVTVINDEKSSYNTSQEKDKYEGKLLSAQDNHETASTKQSRTLLAGAEDSKKNLKISKKEHLIRKVKIGVCSVERRDITPGTLKSIILEKKAKDRQN